MSSKNPVSARWRDARVTLTAAAMLAAYATAAQANVVISSAATTNMNCSGGVCTATKKNAVLNVRYLRNMLASSSLKVATGTKPTDIEVAASLNWVSASTLTLDAYHSILIDKPVSDAGAGPLTLITNDGGTGGTLSFGTKGNVTFLGLTNILTINGAAYTLVASISQLASDIATNASGFYALATSYDASADGTYTSSPIATSFTGSLEGLGNRISNLAINPTAFADIGLFEDVGTGGGIENLGLTGVSITGTDLSGVGGLAGRNHGFLFGDFVSGAITVGDAAPGGLVGVNDTGGTIDASYASVQVTAGDEASAGGLAGTNYEATITSAHAAGVVKVCCIEEEAGGLVGSNYSGTVSGSYATGAVRGRGADLGGLVGQNNGLSGPVATIGDSYATGAVTERKSGTVGGLVGHNDEGTITNSYSTGAATALTGGTGTYVGGLVGFDDSGSSIATSYATGAPAGGTGSYVGGLVGRDGGTISFSYWDTTTSGITDPSQGAGYPSNDPGITGMTTVQLQSDLPGGFSNSIWGETASINGGLPYLLSLPPA